MTDGGSWLVTQGKALTQDAETHCRTEILS